MNAAPWSSRAYPIKAGETIEQSEPVVGRWYCGFNVGTDGQAIDGELARYEGAGQWSGDDEESESEPDMRAYQYLVEQV